jgi:hypothetical protein
MLKKRSPAQLDREIAQALGGKRSPQRAAKPRYAHSTKGGRKLGSVGDVDPISYGGGYLFSTPGGGGPHIEYFEGLDSDERASRVFDDDKIDALKVQLYRVDLGKDAKDFLSDYDWVDWKDIARSTGGAASDYASSKLGTAQARAHALQDAAGYHGWHSFDSYPLELTVGELKKRWGE